MRENKVKLSGMFIKQDPCLPLLSVGLTSKNRKEN